VLNPIAVAIPFFLVTILGEMGWSAREGRWARPRAGGHAGAHTLSRAA